MLREKMTAPINLPEIVDKKVNAAYEQIRAQISGEEDENIIVTARRKGYGVYRKFAVAAAALAFLVGTPAIVLAATGFFDKEARLEEDTLTYEFQINYELQPGTFDVTAGYVPAGYVARNDNKYWTEGGNMGFSLIPVCNTAELDRIGGQIQTREVAEVEHTVLSGLEADIITYKEADRYEAPTRIYLFNAMEGYVMEVWGAYGMPLEELVKVADNLTITRTGTDEFYVEAEKTDDSEDMPLPTAKEENIIPIGQSFTKDQWAVGEISFTVLDAEFSDTLGEADPQYFSNYDELAEWLTEDGALRPYIRQRFDETGACIAEETVGQRFLWVKVRADRGSLAGDSDGIDSVYDNAVALDACLRTLGEPENGVYALYGAETTQPLPSEHNYLQTDRRCIWLNALDPGEDGQFFYRKMEEGDSIEYEMIFVLDADVPEEKLVLDFNQFTDPSADGVYFALH